MTFYFPHSVSACFFMRTCQHHEAKEKLREEWMQRCAFIKIHNSFL